MKWLICFSWPSAKSFSIWWNKAQLVFPKWKGREGLFWRCTRASYFCGLGNRVYHLNFCTWLNELNAFSPIIQIRCITIINISLTPSKPPLLVTIYIKIILHFTLLSFPFTTSWAACIIYASTHHLIIIITPNTHPAD